MYKFHETGAKHPKLSLQIHLIPHFEKVTLITSITFGWLVYEITSVSPDGSRYG